MYYYIVCYNNYIIIMETFLFLHNCSSQPTPLPHDESISDPLSASTSLKVHKCMECSKYFGTKSGLRRHIKSKHPDFFEQGAITCREVGCSFMCRKLKALRVHLNEEHGRSMITEIHSFTCIEGILIIRYVHSSCRML